MAGDGSLLAGTSIAGNALLILLGTGLVWLGSNYLERSSERLSVFYGLPPIIQGAVVVAVGSSFPELASVVSAAALHGSFDLGVGAVVGSAIFNLLVIPAAAGIATDTEVQASRDLVYKEAQFYMIAVAAVIITFAVATIYNPNTATANPFDGNVTRGMALVPVALYGVYVFTQYQDTVDFDPEAEPTEVDVLVEWGYLALSLVIIAVAVEFFLVEPVVYYGAAFDINGFLWGVTIIAASSSLPDAIVSVRAAKAGEGVTSLANVLGSNIFDLLIAVPAGVLVAGTLSVRFDIAVPMLGFLTFATVVVFAFLRTDFHLSDREAYALLGLYASFVLWILLEVLGTLDFVPGT